MNNWIMNLFRKSIKDKPKSVSNKPKPIDPCSIFYWKDHYDDKGRISGRSNADGFWCKYFYDENDKEIYYYDSDGNSCDYRKFK